MPRTLKAKILDERTNEEEIAEFTFTDEEWQTLQDFVRYAHDLRESSPVQEGIPTSLTVKWTQGEGIKVDAKTPSDDKIDALLMKLRPFILKKEPTGFHAVRNLVEKATSNKAAKEHLRTLRFLFTGKHLQSLFVIGASSSEYPNGAIINSEEMLNIWLNGHRFHKDKDKQKIFSAMHGILPPESSVAFFLFLLTDKIKAILGLEAIISILTGDREKLLAEVILEPPIRYRAFLHATVSALQFFDRSSTDMGDFPPRGPWEESFDLTDLGAGSVPGFLDVVGQLWMQERLSREIGERYYFFRLAPGFSGRDGNIASGEMDIIVNLKVEVLLAEDPLSRARRKPDKVTLERLKQLKEARRSSTVVLKVISGQEELNRILGQEPRPVVEWLVVPRVAFMFAYWPLSKGARDRIEEFSQEGRDLSFEEVEGTDISSAWEIFSEVDSPEEDGD